uniref:Uncharacterized protein n=1 Tax=Lepeophtheirus salmonis TaxID=72036 RepID=A0A0K2UCD1_LEPSM
MIHSFTSLVTMNYSKFLEEYGII